MTYITQYLYFNRFRKKCIFVQMKIMKLKPNFVSFFLHDFFIATRLLAARVCFWVKVQEVMTFAYNDLLVNILYDKK